MVFARVYDFDNIATFERVSVWEYTCYCERCNSLRNHFLHGAAVEFGHEIRDIVAVACIKKAGSHCLRRSSLEKRCSQLVISYH